MKSGKLDGVAGGQMQIQHDGGKSCIILTMFCIRVPETELFEVLTNFMNVIKDTHTSTCSGLAPLDCDDGSDLALSAGSDLAQLVRRDHVGRPAAAHPERCRGDLRRRPDDIHDNNNSMPMQCEFLINSIHI